VEQKLPVSVLGASASVDIHHRWRAVRRDLAPRRRGHPL